MSKRPLAIAFCVGLSSACGSPPPPRTPSDTLSSYARALREGRAADAYALLSDEAKKGMPYEAFERILRENTDEVTEIATALARPSGPPLVTATVTGPSGETLLLVYEDGSWRVDGSAIDLYGQATPDAAVKTFVRAFENKRYDVMLRLAPERDAVELDTNKLRASLEGEQREETERLTQALRAALPTAKFEIVGDRATMAYGVGGTVELVREHGAWKVEGLY